MSTLQERLWLYRIRSRRDSEAFALIYDRFVSQLYRFILFKVGDDEEAKEISSETFMKAWEYLSSGKPVKSLSGLLYTIARAAIADSFRKRRLELVSLDEAPEAADGRMSGFAELNEELKSTLAAIRLLKEEYRDALLMKHVDGLSNNEIAAALEKSAGATRVLIHRATAALKEVMERN